MASPTQEEQLDPRVQIELEKLNTATDDINKLEAKLEEANNDFRATLSESTARLKTLAKKLGNCIEKARPYYEALELARTSQLDCQRAAVQYQRANALHQAAKETIALAEERFVNSRHQNWQFDSAWQEMLNHATMKVMEAEAQKAASEREHQRRAAVFQQAEQRVQQLQRGLRSAINKSLIYFEEKAGVQAQLESQKEKVQQLQQAVGASKTSYAASLRSLEQISEEIHEQRRCRLPREPGVGAELTTPAPTEERPSSPTTSLEDTTASEEKYWEGLRQKLASMQPNSPDSVEEELEARLLSPRIRSVSGSSYVPDPEEEASLSGTGKITEDLDGAQGAQHGQQAQLEAGRGKCLGAGDSWQGQHTTGREEASEAEESEGREEKGLSGSSDDLQADQGEIVQVQQRKQQCDASVPAPLDEDSSQPDKNVAASRVKALVQSFEEGQWGREEPERTDSMFRGAEVGASAVFVYCHQSVHETAHAAATVTHQSRYQENWDSEEAEGVKDMGDGASSPPPPRCRPSFGLATITEERDQLACTK